MRHPRKSRRHIVTLWLAVSVVCAIATLVGYVIAQQVGGDVKAAIDGFAAGALLVMLTDSMIPEAKEKAGDWAGLVTVLGFAVAAVLSNLPDRLPTRR